MDEIQRIGATTRAELERLTPTPKQLAYLKALAYRQGATFVVPVTRQQADAEIKRLQREPRARAVRRRKHKQKRS